MASGRINVGSCTSYSEVNYIWYIDWSSTSDVGSNTSSVYAAFYVERAGTKNNTVYQGSVNATLTINGTEFRNSSFRFDLRNTAVGTRHKITEGTVSVGHNADGTKSIYMSGYFPTTTSTAGVQSGGGTAYLDTIARASQPTLGAGTIQIGNSVTIYSNRASSSFTHDAWFSFGGISWRHIGSFSDTISFTLPMDMLNQIASATSGTGTVIVRTYSNGANIGDKTVSFTATVGGNIVPGIGDITLDTDTQVNSSWIFVQNKSKARVRTNCWGTYGSWITTCRVTMEGREYWGTDTWTGVITGSGARDVTITVWDSRNRTASKTVQLTSIAYWNPSITTASAYRCNTDGTANDSGSSVKVNFSASISSVGNANSKSFTVEAWSNGVKEKTLYSNTSAYTTDISTVYNSFSTDKSYIIRFIVSDWYTSNSRETVIATAFVLMDFKGSGKGVAFGKVSETDNLMEIAMDAKLTNSTISKAGTSQSWLNGARGIGCMLNMTSKSDYTPMIRQKAEYGAWTWGVYTNDTYHLTYITDDNINNGNNAPSTQYSFPKDKGGVVYTTGNKPSAGDIGAIPTSASCNKNWYWSGQGGQPPWLWGGSDGTNMYVYNPSNFTVNWASGASYSQEWRATGYGTSYLCTGNGDAASWSTHNVILRTWNGLGVHNNGDACTFLIDARSGNTFSQGYMMATKFSQSSDARLKENITPINKKFEDFFMQLKAVNYNMIDLDDGRLHNGFIAQEVEKAMTSNNITYEEFAGLEKNKYMSRNTANTLPEIIGEGEIEYSLCYGEFTALNTHMIQKCIKRIDVLEKELELLKAQVNPT